MKPRKFLMWTKNNDMVWSGSRIIEIGSESAIYQLLVMTPEEGKHSLAPSVVTIQYTDGFQHRYQIYQEICTACGQALPED